METKFSNMKWKVTWFVNEKKLHSYWSLSRSFVDFELNEPSTEFLLFFFFYCDLSNTFGFTFLFYNVAILYSKFKNKISVFIYGCSCGVVLDWVILSIWLF